MNHKVDASLLLLLLLSPDCEQQFKSVFYLVLSLRFHWWACCCSDVKAFAFVVCLLLAASAQPKAWALKLGLLIQFLIPRCVLCLQMVVSSSSPMRTTKQKRERNLMNESSHKKAQFVELLPQREKKLPFLHHFALFVSISCRLQ